MIPKAIVRDGVVPTLCRMCDTRCAVKVHLNEGVIVDITPQEGHPINQGRMCPRGGAAIDLFYHPDRLLKPLKRTPDGGFEEISLERALDEIAQKLQDLKAEHGPASVGFWKGEGLGFFQQEQYVRRFARAFGSPNYFSNDSACFNGRYFGHKLVTGFYNPFPRFSEADLILLFGTNPPMCHPPFMRELAEARQKGSKLVLIDPRLNPIVCYADIFAQPYPGTDGALAWGLINYLIGGKNYDFELVEHYSVGFEKLAQYARGFTPEYVEEQSGIWAQVVRDVGEMIIRHRPRVSIYAGTGLEHHQNGVNNIRAVAALACLIGTLDIDCGMYWAEPMNCRNLSLEDELPLPEESGSPLGADKFPVLYDLAREGHSMTAMDSILSPDENRLRGMIITAANPAVTNPNSAKVEKALSSLELLVVQDFFLSKTARLADYILPAATFLERTELHYYRTNQLVGLSTRIMEIPGVPDAYTLWRELALRLGFGEQYFPWTSEEAVNRHILEPSGLTVEELARRPEGVQFKPIKYRKHLNRPLPTASGKVEFTSDYLKKLGLSELPEYVPPYHQRNRQAEYPHLLTTGARKSLFYNSRHQNIPRFRSVHARPEVEIHPDDARELGIEPGEIVRIVSARGAVEVAARIVLEPEFLPGVCEMYHGWEECRINLLTFDDVNDPISGFPLLKGVPVRIEKIL